MDYPTKEDYLSELDLEVDRFDSIPSDETIQKTIENLESCGFRVELVETGEEAVEHLKEMIPSEASIMNGHSTTLEEIGFIDYLKEEDVPWENLHEKVFSIEDDEAMHAARRKSQTADYFLGSVQGIARTGELVAAGASGSRIGAYPYAAKHVIIVSGINKIMPSLDAACERLEEFAYPLEDARAEEVYDMGSSISKQLIFRHEGKEGRVRIILVKDRLGF